jgi:hypothetical protein
MFAWTMRYLWALVDWHIDIFNRLAGLCCVMLMRIGEW